MKLVNLTPHKISVYTEEKELIMELPACDNPLRVQQVTSKAGTITVDNYSPIPMYTTTYSETQYIPPSVSDVLYVVSLIIANQYPHRKDFLIPSPYVRDEAGNIIGCTGFTRIESAP